jgi:hypothetical protein
MQTPEQKRQLINKLVAGDTINTRTESILGKAIRFFTNSNINHSTIYLGNDLLLEASYEVCIHHVNEYILNDKHEIYCSSPKVDKKIKQQLVVAAINTWGAGVSYDAIGIIGLAVRFTIQKYWWRIKGLFNWSGKNKAAQNNSVWCSELLGKIYLNQDPKGQKLINKDFEFKFTGEDVSYLTPDQIYNSINCDKISI